MANTVIQLKYSTVTATPTALNVAEPAYSYSSNTLFIGSPSGTGSIAIGGKFYLDQQASIYNLVNAAFTTANAAGTSTFAQSAFNQANAAFASANVSVLVDVTQNNSIAAAFAQANTATNNAGSASIYANGAFTQANTAVANALSASNYANGAFITANSASTTAAAAFARANNAINANTGGVITADLVVTGNLTVQGRTTYVDTQTLTAGDSLIHLANNNTVGDTVDIGFYGSYNPGAGVKYTGLVRQAGANYFLFKGLDSDLSLIHI